MAPGRPPQYADGVPASTVAVNAAIRLSIRRRLAIALAMLLLLAGTVGSAWVSTCLTRQARDVPQRVAVGDLQVTLPPIWVPHDAIDPPALQTLTQPQTLRDITSPQRLLTVARFEADRPSEAVALSILTTIIRNRANATGNTPSIDITAVPLPLPRGLSAAYMIGRSDAPDDGIGHHHAAVVTAPGTTQRWLLYLLDRPPDGDPLMKHREAANVMLLREVLATARLKP
jgi:hypothetical protein